MVVSIIMFIYFDEKTAFLSNLLCVYECWLVVVVVVVDAEEAAVVVAVVVTKLSMVTFSPLTHC